MRRLNQDRVWTTNLGDAFLAQQADVMQAVQRMRRAAKDAGKLSTNRQMKVVETTDSGETVIEIEPASPNVIFVPSYNPAWIWGPPLWYPYPRWFWGPAPVAPGVWFGFGPAIAVGAFYGPGWGGWGYWGWRPGWVNNTVVVNNTFINNTSVSNVSNTTGTANPATASPAAASPATTSPAAANPSATSSSTAAPSSALASKTNVGSTAPGSAPAGSTNTGATGAANPAGATTGSANAGTSSANASAANASAGKANTGAPNSNASNASPAANARTSPQTSTWTHDPSHRQGVPYANAEVAQRFHAPPPLGQRRGSPAASARPAGNGHRGNAPLARSRGGVPRGGQPKGGGGKR